MLIFFRTGPWTTQLVLAGDLVPEDAMLLTPVLDASDICISSIPLRIAHLAQNLKNGKNMQLTCNDSCKIKLNQHMKNLVHILPLRNIIRFMFCLKTLIIFSGTRWYFMSRMPKRSSFTSQ